MKRPYIRWTEKELKELKECCKSMKRKEIYKKFYPHSYLSIKHKIHDIGCGGKIAYGKNEYIVNGETTTIVLRRLDWTPVKCLISTVDLPKVLNRGRWSISKGNSHNDYVAIGDFSRHEYLHRFIMNCPKDKFVDHINGNTLDCTRSNMRIVTPSENNQNKHRLQSNNKSGYRGVCWDKCNKRWRTTVKLHGVQIVNKYFKEKEDAILCAIEARKKYMPYSQEALNS